MTPEPLGHHETRIWEPDRGAPGGKKNREAFRYDTFLPVSIGQREFSLRTDAAALIERAYAALVHLNNSPPTLDSLEALSRHLLRTESLASSRIEGLELSHRRLAEAAHAGEGGHDQRAAEVLGNVVAMERAIEIGATANSLTPDDIKDIHRRLLRFTIDEPIAGVLRTKQSWIGRNHYTPRNAAYVPPPWEKVEGLVEDLCEFINRDDLPALVQAAIAHAQFETIHPFADGNGRIGRALIHCVLRRRGAAPHYTPPVSLILATRRDEYIAGLVSYREGDVDQFCEAFAAATHDACTEAERLAASIANLQTAWIDKLGNPRRDAAVRSVIAALPAHPVLDVKTAQRVTGKTKVAANNAVNSLERAGVLKPIGSRQRDRTWECPQLLELVTKFERDLSAA